MCVLSTPFRYLVTPSLLKSSGDAFKELGWRELERLPICPGRLDADETKLVIPGGGITKGLYTDRYGVYFPSVVVSSNVAVKNAVLLKLQRGRASGCAAALLL